MKTNNQFFLSRIDGISTRFGFINRIVNQIADKILPKAIAQAAGCVPANCWATNAEPQITDIRSQILNHFITCLFIG